MGFKTSVLIQLSRQIVIKVSKTIVYIYGGYLVTTALSVLRTLRRQIPIYTGLKLCGTKVIKAQENVDKREEFHVVYCSE